MNDRKRDLEGSESRDRFKYHHKNQCHSQFYSLDIDFVWVEKNEYNAPDGGDLPVIVAILDFKLPSDDPVFTEVLAYNQFLERGIPVYIVQATSEDFVEQEPDEHRFDVYQYLDGDYHPEPPDWDGELVLENATWDEFNSWEDDLRIQRRNERQAFQKVMDDIEREMEQAEDPELIHLLHKMHHIIGSNPALDPNFELPDSLP